MIRAIIKAIGVGLALEFGSKAVTGKYLHEHLFQWWCELRDYVAEWLKQNQNLKIRDIGLAVLDHLDDVAVRTKQIADWVTLGVFGVDAQQNVYEIATQEVPLAEAYEQFPELRGSPVIMQELQ
ncbi:MAG: hypothetical protein ABSA47_18110 [Verrucomicrobiota bacterium]|jgi:hypothetical protein